MLELVLIGFSCEYFLQSTDGSVKWIAVDTQARVCKIFALYYVIILTGQCASVLPILAPEFSKSPNAKSSLKTPAKASPRVHAHDAMANQSPPDLPNPTQAPSLAPDAAPQASLNTVPFARMLRAKCVFVVV